MRTTSLFGLVGIMLTRSLAVAIYIIIMVAVISLIVWFVGLFND